MGTAGPEFLLRSKVFPGSEILFAFSSLMQKDFYFEIQFCLQFELEIQRQPRVANLYHKVNGTDVN